MDLAVGVCLVGGLLAFSPCVLAQHPPVLLGASRPIQDGLGARTSGMVISKWDSSGVTLRAVRPSDTWATDTAVFRNGFQRLRQALGARSGRTPSWPPPCPEETANDCTSPAGMATAPGAIQVAGTDLAMAPCRDPAGARTGALRMTGWGRFGMTLTASNPWQPSCRTVREEPAQGNVGTQTDPSAPSGDMLPGSSPLGPLETAGRVLAAPEPGDAAWVAPPRIDDDRLEALWHRARTEASSDAFRALCGALFSRADWQGLREAAGAWSHAFPASAEALEQLGIAQLGLGEDEEAVAAFLDIAAIDPGRADLADRAGVLLLMTDRADRAEPLFRMAVEAQPDDLVSVRHLALLLWLLERPAEAVRIVEQALATSSLSTSAARTLLDDLGLFYHADLERGGDDWDIRMRAAARGVDLTRWKDVRVVLDWGPAAGRLALHLARDGGPGTSRRPEGSIVMFQAGDGPGIASVRLLSQDPGTWHVGVGATEELTRPVQGTVMVIAPAFREKVSLVLVQPFTLVREGASPRHVMSFDLPGGSPPSGVEAETRVVP